MLKSILRNFKKKYREIKTFLVPHPLFNWFDKIKLSQIKKDTNKEGFYFIKPKGFYHNVKIRKNYIDKEVIYYVLNDKYHLPPSLLQMPDNAVILDLGSNIGLTIAHFKHIYPRAKIIGYEMSKENFLIAKRNTKFYDDVIVINKAVWTDDTTVTFNNSSGHDAYSIIENFVDEDIKQELEEVESFSINSIIKKHNLSHIDYLKMDIEGAEKVILQSEDLRWMDIVQAMNIEMHLDSEEDIDNYIKIILNKGFDAWKDDKHWSSIIAVRKKI
jgi:FkbM family methyltransferase